MLNSARKWIGEAAHALSLAKGLEERGHVVLFGARAGHELERRARDEGMRVASFAMKGRFNGVDDLRDFLKLRHAIRERGIELIHCHRGKDHWLAALARLCAGPRRPVLVRTRHVVTPVRGHAFNRWLYRRATQGVIAVSAAVRASLEAALQTDAAATGARVILPGVDTERFSPGLRRPEVRRRLGAGPETALVGLIGRIQRVKGQRQFLEAAAAVARSCREAHFVLAGKGTPSQVEALRRYADRVGLPRERLTILGVLADLPDVLAALDVGVVASIGSEGSSRIALEYLASGLPVVATRVGGIPDLLDNERTGFLVESHNPTAMAESITRLVTDPGKRCAVGEAGRRSAVQTFSRARWLSETEAFYEEVLRREREGGA